MALSRSHRPHSQVIPPPLSVLCERCPKREHCAFSFIDTREGADEVACPPPAVLTRAYRAGAYLFREGDPLTHLSVVCHGLVLVTVLTEGGESVAIQTKGMGEILGLTDWLQSSAATSCSAQALTNTTIACVKPQVLAYRLSQAGSRWTPLLLKQLGGELLTLQERLSCQTAEDASGRIIHCLLHLTKQIGTDAQKNIRLPITSSREVLARLSGLARETVSRVLADLRKRRLMRVSDRQITIVDLARLRNALAR